MKKIILLFCVILFSGVLSAQPWSEQVSGVTTTLTSVWAVDNNNVWVCGYSGTILKTSNAGTNWINLTSNGIPTNVQLINITGFPGNSATALVTGYLGTTDTWVWKTTNSGNNWTEVFHQTNGFIDAMWMASFTNGYMVGDPVGGRWSLWKTTNGGTNWDSTGLFLAQNGTETGFNNSMIYEPPYIWFGTNNTRIYYSTNNGTNWAAQLTTGELNSYAIWFHPHYIINSGLFGGTTFWQTSNNGVNWSSLNSLGSGNFGGITSVAIITDIFSQFIWYVRSNNIIYYTLNGGINWIAEYTNPTTTTQYRHISFAYQGRAIWVVGTLGKISKHTPLMDIKKLGSEVPLNFTLHQNYPNPFNPRTKIKFDIKKSVAGSQASVVTLKVFDILGKEISSLVNEQLQPGIYEVEWNASNYTSGVYFYRLSSGNFIETKKMLLIK